MAERLGMHLSEFQQLLGELHGLNLGSLQPENSDEFDETADCTYQPNGPDENPFFQCLQSELKSFLAEAMNSLEEKERQVMALYYLEELNDERSGSRPGDRRIARFATALTRLGSSARTAAGTDAIAQVLRKPSGAPCTALRVGDTFMEPTRPLDRIGALREKARGKTCAVRSRRGGRSVSPFDPRQSGQLSAEQTRGRGRFTRTVA